LAATVAEERTATEATNQALRERITELEDQVAAVTATAANTTTTAAAAANTPAAGGLADDLPEWAKQNDADFKKATLERCSVPFNKTKKDDEVQVSLRILAVERKLYIPANFDDLSATEKSAATANTKNTVRQVAVRAAKAVSFWKENENDTQYAIAKANLNSAVFTAQCTSKDKLRKMLPDDVVVPAKMTLPELATTVKVWCFQDYISETDTNTNTDDDTNADDAESETISDELKSNSDSSEIDDIIDAGSAEE
jgi:hypothetical protein